MGRACAPAAVPVPGVCLSISPCAISRDGLFLGCILPGFFGSCCARTCPGHKHCPVHSHCISLGVGRCLRSARPRQTSSGAGACRVCAEPTRVQLPPALPRGQAATARADTALLHLAPGGCRDALGGSVLSVCSPRMCSNREARLYKAGKDQLTQISLLSIFVSLLASLFQWELI